MCSSSLKNRPCIVFKIVIAGKHATHVFPLHISMSETSHAHKRKVCTRERAIQRKNNCSPLISLLHTDDVHALGEMGFLPIIFLLLCPR
jgi:hypothetical protein